MHENRETSETPAGKPDGRSAGEGSGRTARTSGGDPLQLTHDEGNKTVVGFSSDGTEIYLRRTLGESEIWAIPTLGGTPKRLASGLSVTPSADGQSLFLQKADGRIVRTPKSGAGEELIYTLPLTNFPRVILKTYPDGKGLLIINASSRNSAKTSFHRLDLATGKLENFGELPDTSAFASWAIPGKSLYVSRKINGISNLWEFSLEDHSLKQITSGPGPDRIPMSDPNGRGVYFINGRSAGALTLYQVSSKQFSDIVTEDATQPVLSNDGRHLAYITEPEAGKAELWVSDLKGNNRLKLASGRSGLETLAWSNDATKFIFGDNGYEEERLFVINADGTLLQQLPWGGDFVGFALWDPGDQSIVLGGSDKRNRTEKNWRVFLDGTPAALLFEGCGIMADFSPDRKFIIGTVLWGENPGLYQYSLADKKCTTLKSGITTYLAMYSNDGKSFLYSLASHGQTTIFRQALAQWHPRRSPHPP
jgi:Tol biopolymer transport system component